MLQKVRREFHLSPDLPLLPWDTLTQNVILNKPVKSALSLLCYVYQRRSYLSLGPKQSPLSEKCLHYLYGSTAEKTHTWTHFNTAHLSPETKQHERTENIALQLSLKVPFDKLDNYIPIYLNLIHLLTALLFFTLDNRWIYRAVNLMHGAGTRP